MYEIPDGCSLGIPCSEEAPPPSERRAFEGLTTDYLRVSEVAYCTARNAAIDLAEGIGLLELEVDSHCFYDREEWDGVAP